MFKKKVKDQIIERRSSPRKRLKNMVKVDKKKERITEKSINYSLTGLFLKCNTPERHCINDKVEVAFKDEKGMLQTHTGRIVRKSRKGIAIRYQKKDT